MSSSAPSQEISYDTLMETPLRVPFAAVNQLQLPMSDVWSIQFPKTYCHAIARGSALSDVLVLGNPPIGVDAPPIPYRSYLDPFAEQARGTVRHLPIYAKYGSAAVIFQNRLPVSVDGSPTQWDYGLVPCLFALPGTYNMPMGFLPPRQDGSLKVFLAPLQLDSEGAAVLEGMWDHIQHLLKEQDPAFFGGPGVIFMPILTETRNAPSTSNGRFGGKTDVAGGVRKFKYAAVATAPLSIREGDRDPLSGAVLLDPLAQESIRGSTSSNTLGPGFVNGATMGSYPLALENHRRCWPNTRLQTPVFLAEGLTAYFNKTTEKLEIRLKLLLVGGKVHVHPKTSALEHGAPHLIGMQNPFTQASEQVARTFPTVKPIDTTTQGTEYLRAPLVARSHEWVARRLFREETAVASNSASPEGVECSTDFAEEEAGAAAALH